VFEGSDERRKKNATITGLKDDDRPGSYSDTIGVLRVVKIFESGHGLAGLKVRRVPNLSTVVILHLTDPQARLLE
jgi:hypothetical protein